MELKNINNKIVNNISHFIGELARCRDDWIWQPMDKGNSFRKGG